MIAFIHIYPGQFVTISSKGEVRRYGSAEDILRYFSIC
jgi:hypothetical protein